MDENNVVEEMDETEEEEEVLTCPVCGEEVEPGTENCPLCGAPVGTLENHVISGTAIDNSAAIDAMLQSAAMLVEESASLGVALDDDEEEEDDGEDGEDTEQEEEEEDEGEENAEADAMEPVNTAALPSNLTDEQKSQLAAGGMINLSPPDNAPTPKPKKPAPKKKIKKEKEPPAATESEAPTLYNMDEKGNPIPEDDDSEAPYAPPGKKAPKSKEKSGSASPVLVIITAFVALALGCAVGFFGKMVFFPDIVLPECQEFAERAVTGVNSVTEEELYIAEAYVRESGDSSQCVFRAFSEKGDAAVSRWFRVKVYNDAPDTIRIYFQLDMNAYQAMIDSDDAEQRIQASMLMNNQQELERCIDEIKSGTGGWNAANSPMLNDALRPAEKEEPAKS